MKAKIAPALADQRVPIDSIEPHPRNRHRQHDVGAISESYRTFGQLRPIVAQAVDGGPARIVAGKGQWLAAKALKWAEIAVVVHEMDESTALAFIAADNRTQELGSNDQDALADLLRDLAVGGHLKGTGWDGDDVDQLLKDLGQLPAHNPDGTPKGADDEGIVVPSQYAVAVMCEDEPHQREVFDKLVADGYNVKVLAV